MRHQAEYRPTWKPVNEYPPPNGTKILLRTKYGTAVIGQYYPEGEFTHWTGLPRMRPQRDSIDEATPDEWDSLCRGKKG